MIIGPICIVPFFPEIYNQKIYLNVIILLQVINGHGLVTLYRTKENKISACTGIKHVVSSIIIEAHKPKVIPSVQRNSYEAFKRRFLLTLSFYFDL